MRWFRFYDEALNDTKVQRLPPHLFKIWVNLLCLASETQDVGRLPSVDDIAFKLRISTQDAQTAVEELINVGLIDIHPDKRLQMHGWPDRQFASDDSKERVRKYREKHKNRYCNGDVTADVTAQEAEAESDTDSELAARQQDFGFENRKGFAGAPVEVSEFVQQRAEGFGLPAAEILAETVKARPKRPDSYFIAICCRRLKLQAPQASDELLRKAFSQDAMAFTALCGLLMEAA